MVDASGFEQMVLQSLGHVKTPQQSTFPLLDLPAELILNIADELLIQDSKGFNWHDIAQLTRSHKILHDLLYKSHLLGPAGRSLEAQTFLLRAIESDCSIHTVADLLDAGARANKPALNLDPIQSEVKYYYIDPLGLTQYPLYQAVNDLFWPALAESGKPVWKQQRSEEDTLELILLLLRRGANPFTGVVMKRDPGRELPLRLKGTSGLRTEQEPFDYRRVVDSWENDHDGDGNGDYERFTGECKTVCELGAHAPYLSVRRHFRDVLHRQTCPRVECVGLRGEYLVVRGAGEGCEQKWEYGCSC